MCIKRVSGGSQISSVQEITIRRVYLYWQRDVIYTVYMTHKIINFFFPLITKVVGKICATPRFFRIT